MTPVFVVILGDAIGLTFFALGVLILLALWIPAAIKRRLCKHDGGVGETRACEAICHQCGANLGFIGAWRKRNEEER